MNELGWFMLGYGVVSICAAPFLKSNGKAIFSSLLGLIALLVGLGLVVAG